MVPYSNKIKLDSLGIRQEVLEKHGAVSEETVKEMAEQMRSKFKSDIGIATSGIAGPGGGTIEKPVGTVWIACAYKNETVARKLQLSKDRLINIKIASIATLNLVRITVGKDS
jgi:nicotinamide-nucleotide amidase